MKKLPIKMTQELAELEQNFKRAGAGDELEAARELARDGLPVNDIYFMMRCVVSKPAIVLLRAEAKARQVNTTR